MKVNQLTCPNCGASLTIKRENQQSTEPVVCDYCHSSFFLEKNEEKDQKQYSSAKPKEELPRRPKRYSIFIAMAFVMLPLFFTLSRFSFGNFATSKNLLNNFSVSSNNKESLRTTPQSEPVKRFLEMMFQKPMEQITKENLSSIKHLDIKLDKTDISQEVWEIEYSFEPVNYEDDGYREQITSLSLNRINHESIDFEDFQTFTGLIYLNLNKGTDINGLSSGSTLKKLTDLKYYYGGANQDVAEISELLAHPEKVIELGAGLRTEKDSAALAQFNNLETFSVHYSLEDVNPSVFAKLSKLKKLSLTDVTDIAWLSTLSELTSLEINSDDITDFSSLAALTDLEVLTLTSVTNLKNLSFVSNMPKLTALKIRGSSILSLEPLRDKTNLTSLTLGKNQSLTDYAALSSLSGLTLLSITGNVNGEVPDLAMLTSLTEAELPTACLKKLGNQQRITKLSVFHEELVTSLDCSDIARFSSLETLTIEQFFTVKLSNAEALSSLENLHHVTIDNVSFASEPSAFSRLINLPQIQSLTVKNTSLSVDMSVLSPESQLVSLAFHNIGGWDYYQGATRINGNGGIQDFLTILETMPQIKSLSLADEKIADLSIFSNLQQLEYLDVQGNYISDVSPLAQLTALKIINVTDNPVTDTSVLRDDIVVIK